MQRLNVEIFGSNHAEGMDVRELFVMSCVGSGLCDGLITRSEETYHVCVDVIVYCLETCVVHCASVYACTVHNLHATQVILCRHSTDVCTTSISTLNQSCNFS